MRRALVLALLVALCGAELASAQLWRAKHFHKKHVSGGPAVSGAPISGAPGAAGAVTPGQIPVNCVPVAQAAAAAGNFSTLLAAAQAAGLAGTLSSPSLVSTVFAPTDSAFAKALKALKLTSAQLLANPTLLKSVLSYHVVPGVALSSAELGSGRYGQVDTLLEGQSLLINKAVITNIKDFSQQSYNITVIPSGGPSATVVKADIPACQSVIHAIDAILLPAAATAPATKFGH